MISMIMSSFLFLSIYLTTNFVCDENLANNTSRMIQCKLLDNKRKSVTNDFSKCLKHKETYRLENKLCLTCY